MRIFTFITVFLISTFISSAQDEIITSKNKFHFGIRHGYSELNISNNYTSRGRTSVYAGLFLSKSLSEKFSLQLEANYSQSVLLDIPLLLKYKLTNKFDLFTGPQLNLSIDNGSLRGFEDEKYGSSFLLGAQYNINSHWFIDARYTYGLTDQFLIDVYDETPHYGSKNSFNFGIGYKF